MDKLLKLMPLMLLLFLAGCSSKNEDEESEVFSTTLNMMNEANGKTLFEGTQYYIDKSNNFVSESRDWCLVDAGSTSLSNKKWQADPANRVFAAAVQYKHCYHFFETARLRFFPSGKCAVLVGSVFYKLWVDDPITEGNTTKGAVVKFVKTIVSTNALPAKESVIGEMHNGVGNKIEYSVPEGAECTFGYYPTDRRSDFNIQVNGGKLTIELKSWKDDFEGTSYIDYEIYIRHGTLWTPVFFRVKRY